MFSKATEYALRATIFIAQKGTIDHKLGIEEIAKAIDSPQSFTAKILQVLTKNNRIVSSVRGPRGGFYMTAAAKKLPLSTILKALEDETVYDKCILGLKKCSEINPCPLHFEFKAIRKDLSALFETKTIQQTAEETDKENIFINNFKR